jgi:hypothetical protein
MKEWSCPATLQHEKSVWAAFFVQLFWCLSFLLLLLQPLSVLDDIIISIISLIIITIIITIFYYHRENMDE